MAALQAEMESEKIRFAQAETDDAASDLRSVQGRAEMARSRGESADVRLEG
jgi:hypothetical protein